MRDRGRNLTDGEREIWNEMQADAAPSQEEAEQMQREAEELHAELKAVLALVESLDERQHIDVVYEVADTLGFDLVVEEIDPYLDRWHAGRKRFGDLVSRHKEPHEIPDPEETGGQPHPALPGYPVRDRVRELKAEAWQRLPHPRFVHIEKEKRPAGGAVRFDVTVKIGELETQVG